ncbi:MAG: deoxyribodipyrimidine photo-lyase [Ferruginibacter sp.]
MDKPIVNIFWFRRDLRLDDNAGLYYALKSKFPVIPLFVFDTNILDILEDRSDPRVSFIHSSILNLKIHLEKTGSTPEVHYGIPLNIFKLLVSKYRINTVFTNHDYEPYATERDNEIKDYLHTYDILFKTCKDQVIFEKNEIIKDDGKPYTIFTPYSRKWLATLNEFYLKSYPSEKLIEIFYKQPPLPFPTLQEIGFKASGRYFPPNQVDEELVKQYGEQRNFPGTEGTSRIGIHLRFGTISIRQLVSRTKELSGVYLNELIWRDFYQAILWHFPKVGKGASFKPAYDNIKWRNDEGEFEKWCNGQTGYPIVDAGMRELNETGFMHNRVRMVTASFLCKHLLIDWRLGEAYFAEKLLDYDLAANNGGWQWASGSGCDSAPYFRIFNPYLQTKKFDSQLVYIKTWVPEFQEFSYLKPIVEHEFARKRCLEVYSQGIQQHN